MSGIKSTNIRRMNSPAVTASLWGPENEIIVYFDGQQRSIKWFSKADISMINVYHRILGNSDSNGNTLVFLRIDLSCLRIGWPTSVGTMDM